MKVIVNKENWGKKFVAADGKEFTSQNACMRYEKEEMPAVIATPKTATKTATKTTPKTTKKTAKTATKKITSGAKTKDGKAAERKYLEEYNSQVCERKTRHTSKKKTKKVDRVVGDGKKVTVEVCLENTHGVTAFQYGEKIDANSPKIFLTGVNIALMATRTKRDHNTNNTIFQYLNDIDAGLKSAYAYMDANGVITNFDYYLKEDIEDAIYDAVSVLRTHDGEKFSREIAREASNHVGKTWAVDKHHPRNAERFLSVSLDAEREEHGDAFEESVVSASVFINSLDDGEIRNKVLLEVLGKLPKEDKYMVLMSACHGMTHEDIADALGRSRSYVSKRLKAVLNNIKNSLVLADNGRTVTLAK